MAAKPVRRSFNRLAVCVVLLMCLLSLYEYQFPDPGPRQNAAQIAKHTNMGMTEQQCRAAFPGLTMEVDALVERGPFRLERANDDYMGLVQGRIADGKLYITSYDHKPNRDMLFERTATLQALHRAIITTPFTEPLPDTIFALTVLDTPRNNTWSFSRSNNPLLSAERYWVMPHFSSWSWPLPFIGTADEALAKIDVIEEMGWEQKIDKTVWRGTAWFNNVGNTDLRPKLLKVTKGKEWADVEQLVWGSNAVTANNSLSIEVFCRYKYMIYTEGITYSGRLPFHQACASILLIPPINYLMHTTHSIRPVLASSLLNPFSPPVHDSRWPTTYSASEGNAIFVDDDWKDIEATVMWLREHPAVAEGIARRQRKTFVESGVLSMEAEVCYWRALIRAWSSVAVLGEGWDGAEGVRWETFALGVRE
ncbi:hypothetical protein BJ878DRAFT_556520 [Calycina marina]|uniref:Glycosyl transferase CAP10 domain-containing protein n=1 Tax=Calycina marina TaxID=1763456 RepID=A0A9P8CCJ5_9HELO|nr:hypothetical protein BJ878DRAFT_556520 [Calycina marina]